MNVVAHIRYFWYNTQCLIRLQYNVATGYIMAEWFFNKKSKGEVERDPVQSVCFVLYNCSSKSIVGDKPGPVMEM